MINEKVRGDILQVLTETQLGQDGLSLSDKFTSNEIYELADALMGRLLPTPLEQVAEFHDMFEHPILDEPDIPSSDRCILRLKLIFEELHELSIAMGEELSFVMLIDNWIGQKTIDNLPSANVDMEEALDALVDLEYVLMGAVLELGMTSIFYEAFREVHESNMTKASTSYQVARDTVSYRLDKYGEVCNIIEKPPYFIIKRNDDKIIKSISYKEAKVGHLIWDVKAKK